MRRHGHGSVQGQHGRPRQGTLSGADLVGSGSSFMMEAVSRFALIRGVPRFIATSGSALVSCCGWSTRGHTRIGKSGFCQHFVMAEGIRLHKVNGCLSLA